MIKFDKPKNLNGFELRQQLIKVGVNLPDSKNAILVEENVLFLDINDNDYDKANSVVINHNGTDIFPDISIEDKLIQVGLSVDQLKSALNL